MDRWWRELVHRQVVRRCGHPDEQVARYGHRFGDWVDAAPDTGRPDLAEVEAGIAGYLSRAAAGGRRWGTYAGLLLGAVAALVAFLAVRLAG